MPINSVLSEGTLYAFLLVLARIAGAFAMVPIPGMQSGTEIPRLVASLAITVALYPVWPHLARFPSTIAALALALLCESAFGLTVGLAVSCFTEMLQMSAQIMSQQAGFGYASMIDPMTAADSGLLLVIARLIGSLLFLALGLDREVIRTVADSLSAHPPGVFQADPHMAEALWRFASEIFVVGVRLALPSIALLGLIDLSIALLGRINSQLHLNHLSFPVKMMAAVALIAVLAGLYPRVLSSKAGLMTAIARRAAGLNDHAR